MAKESGVTPLDHYKIVRTLENRLPRPSAEVESRNTQEIDTKEDSVITISPASAVVAFFCGKYALQALSHRDYATAVTWGSLAITNALGVITRGNGEDY